MAKEEPILGETKWSEWRAVAAALLLVAACSPQSRETAAVAANEPAAPCVREWKRIANGADYRMQGCSPADLHLVRIDPKLFQLDAVMQPGATAQSLAQAYPFVMNANFFDEQFRPLGVVMSNGKELNRPHPVSWQSVFLVTGDGTPRIVLVEEWKSVRDDARMAVQCGPRLIVAGKPTDAREAPPSQRAGVCVTAEKQALFFATPAGRELTVKETTALLSGLGCRDAMLFDGGHSVQLHLAGAVRLEGDDRVPAFVVGKP